MTAAHEDHAFPFVEMNAEGQPTAIETGMTLRQYAAIKLRVPNSGTDWLDEMIREAKRDEFAAKAMQSILDSGHHFNIAQSIVSKAVAELAYEYADAMLKTKEQNHD